MELTNYKINDQKDLERLCLDAGKACFAVPTSQGQWAMQMVIQNLVLPRDSKGYGAEDMAKYIQRKLQVVMAVRGVLNGG